VAQEGSVSVAYKMFFLIKSQNIFNEETYNEFITGFDVFSE
jgi:hypothetical protein